MNELKYCPLCNGFLDCHYYDHFSCPKCIHSDGGHKFHKFIFKNYHKYVFIINKNFEMIYNSDLNEGYMINSTKGALIKKWRPISIEDFIKQYKQLIIFE